MSTPEATAEDQALDNAIAALGQGQKGSARQFLRIAIDVATAKLLDKIREHEPLSLSASDGIDRLLDSLGSANEESAKLRARAVELERVVKTYDGRKTRRSFYRAKQKTEQNLILIIICTAPLWIIPVMYAFIALLKYLK